MTNDTPLQNEDDIFSQNEKDLLFTIYSLPSFEKEYWDLIKTWETYKTLLINAENIDKVTNADDIKYSLNIIAYNLVRQSWSSMMRIWDEKSTVHENLSMKKVVATIRISKYDEAFHPNRQEYRRIRKEILRKNDKNRPLIKAIKFIRDNHLSHNNFRLSEENNHIFKNPLSTHTYEEFDHLYHETGELIKLAFNFFAIEFKNDHREKTISFSERGASELCNLILKQ